MSQKPQDDKEKPYHTVAGYIYIFIPGIMLEEGETCFQQQADISHGVTGDVSSVITPKFTDY